MKNHQLSHSLSWPGILSIGVLLSLTCCSPKTSLSNQQTDKSTQAAPSAQIDPVEALSMIRRGAVLIDVRRPDEFAAGHLPGAINIPHDQIVDGIKKAKVELTKTIVLYCRSGRRSGLAQQELLKLGYYHAFNAGGYDDLESARKNSR